MSPRPASFDRLAGLYRPLEFLAFGRDLERARFHFLPRLHACRRILVLGEGDGRCLAQLVRAAPVARIHCIDASAAMLARAASRIAGTEAQARVTFECNDILAAQLPAAAYDAVITLFFLDCFTTPQAERVVAHVQAVLQPEACWLFADFVVPPHGLARWRARAWVALLYVFFRWETGVSARALPPSEQIIRDAGFEPEASRELQGGLLRSVIFRRGRGAA